MKRNQKKEKGKKHRYEKGAMDTRQTVGRERRANRSVKRKRKGRKCNVKGSKRDEEETHCEGKKEEGGER